MLHTCYNHIYRDNYITCISLRIILLLSTQGMSIIKVTVCISYRPHMFRLLLTGTTYQPFLDPNNYYYYHYYYITYCLSVCWVWKVDESAQKFEQSQIEPFQSSANKVYAPNQINTGSCRPRTTHILQFLSVYLYQNHRCNILRSSATLRDMTFSSIY